MTWLDLAAVVILIITGIWGFRRGFILEVADILSIIFAFIFTSISPVKVGKYYVLSYLISFLLYFVLLHFIFIIASRFIRKTPFVIIDKGLGIFIGFLKGFFFVFVVVLFLSFIPNIGKKYSAVRNSYIYKMTEEVKPLILFYFRYERKNRRV